MFKTALILAQSAVTDRKGVTAAEYAILAVALVLAVGAAMAVFGPALTAKFTAILA